ncbi:hypothetical protein PG5_61840 [Pseudomonas sp. G5(2012)]|nr:hypothetical protein PG5_61840 [Pseudomonas sp. G5(2012)]
MHLFGFANGEGHGLAVAQGHGQGVILGLVQLDGEARILVFRHRAIADDGDADLVVLTGRLVGDSGFQRVLPEGQFFEIVRTAHRFQLVDDGRLAADQDVIRGGDGERTGSRVGRHLDLCAIGQGEGQFAVIVDRQTGGVGQGHGVGDLAAFGDGGFIRGECRNDFADGIADDHRRRIANDQVFQNPAIGSRTADAKVDGAAVLIDVITLGWQGVSGLQRTCGDHHSLAVAQGHGQVVIKLLVNLDGESRCAILQHVASTFDDDSDCVARSSRLVGDGRGQRVLIQGQLFEFLATRHGFQLVDQRGLAAGEHVIGRGHDGRTRGAVRWNGDGRAVGKLERQLAVVVDWQARCIAQGHGIGDQTAFNDRRLVDGQGGDHFAGSVADVNFGFDANHQVFKRLAVHSGGGDAQLDGLAIFINIITLSRQGVGGLCRAGRDGYGLAVAQSHRQIMIELLIDFDNEGRRGIF